MMRRLSRVFVGFALAAVVFAQANPASAQARVRAGRSQATRTAQPTWLGISYSPARGVGVGSAEFMITAVYRGSPAFRAGLTPGDHIIRVNGRRITNEAFTDVLRAMKTGEAIQFAVRRGRNMVELEVVPETRPVVAQVPNVRSFALRFDSMRASILENFNASRVRIEGSGEDAIVVVTTSTGGGHVVRLGQNIHVSPEEDTHEFSFQFEISEAIESLPFVALLGQSAELEQLLKRRSSVRQRLERAVEEERVLFSTTRAGERSRPQASQTAGRTLEVRLVELQGSRSEMEVELRAVEEEVRVLSRRTLSDRAKEFNRRVIDDLAPVAQFGPVRPTRPLAPFIIGQRMVAGAELTELNPALASYFQVDVGVLITKVVEHTPAAEAGVQPGDVVISVEGRSVSSPAELRAAVAMARRPTLWKVVRKGAEIEVRLP